VCAVSDIGSLPTLGRASCTFTFRGAE
jgi:hypothetical protein